MGKEYLRRAGNVLRRAFDADPNERRFHLVCLICITLLGGWLRLHGADVQSFKIWDDSFTLNIALGSFSDIIKTFQYQFSDGYAEYQTPLYYFIEALFLRLGHSDLVARLPGILAGTALIPMLYLLCRDLANARVGLYAALLCAVSLYQVESSQIIRVYMFFLFISVACAFVFLRAVTMGGRRRWAGFAAMSILSLYASYLNAVNVAFQCAFVLLCAAAALARKDKPAAKRLILGYAAAMLVAVIAYAPWIKTQMIVRSMLVGDGATSGQPFFEALFAVVGKFAFNYNDFLGFPVHAQWVLALAAAGALACLLLARFRALVFMLLWMGALLAMLRLGGGALHIRSRHVMPVLPGIYFFAACAVDFGVTGVLRLLRLSIVNREAVLILAGLCLVLAMQQPNLRTYDYFYRREDDRLKELAWELASTRKNLTHEYFLGMETKWTPDAAGLFFDRYLPGIFADLGTMARPGYRRCLILAPGRDRETLRRKRGWISGGAFPGVTWFKAGFVSRAPLELAPDADGACGYADDFSGLAVFSDAASLRRLRIDAAGLRPVARSAPGEVEYRFSLPPGATLEEASLQLDAVVTGGMYDLPDARILVFAGTGPDLPLAKEITTSDKATVERRRYVARVGERIPLAGLSSSKGPMAVRVALDPGKRRGLVELRRLEFAFKLSGFARDPDGPVRRQAASIRNNASAARYRPGERPMAPDALYCFSMDDARTGYGPEADFDSREALEAFLRERPGTAPVATLTFADGAPAFAFYDPALDRPDVELHPGQPSLFSNATPTPIPINGLLLQGVLDAPVLDLGKTRIRVPIASPAPLSVYLNKDGSGLIQASLLYTPEGFGLQAASALGKMRQNNNEECATCRDKSPCFVEYEIVSEFSLSEFAVTSYPRVFSDAARRGFANMSYSLDGGGLENAYRYTTPGTGVWEGLNVPRVFRRKPDKPFRRLKVRFDLSGDDAQLWSSQAYPMRILVGFEASGLVAPDIAAGLSTARLEGNGGKRLDAYFSPDPFNFFRGVRARVDDAAASR